MTERRDGFGRTARGFTSEDPKRPERPGFREQTRVENAYCKRATEKAILVGIVGSAELERWVPQSLVHEDSEVYDAGHQGVLVIPLWLAKKNGWAE